VLLAAVGVSCIGCTTVNIQRRGRSIGIIGEDMKRMTQIFPLIAVVTLCPLNSIAWSQAAQQPLRPLQLTAAGSGVNLGITRLLAEAFTKHHSQITIEVPGSIGTRGAIKATADGAITFGLISRSLKEEEMALGLKAKSYARVPIVVGTHPGVKDKGITFQELIDIYKGTKTRWKDGNEIIVQAREKSDSGFLVLENEIPGFKEAYAESHQAKRWSVYFTDQDANQALSTTPYSIGVSDLGMISTENLNIKILEINGLLPSPENLLNGSYPLGRALSFIYREESLPEGAKAFLDFVRSEEGRKILKSNGYLPLN
jgi:phosphate transport system substrate-binding protein